MSLVVSTLYEGERGGVSTGTFHRGKLMLYLGGIVHEWSPSSLLCYVSSKSEVIFKILPDLHTSVFTGPRKKSISAFDILFHNTNRYIF